MHHKYAIHPPVLVCLNWLVLKTVPDIDLRFSPSGPLTRLTSDLGTVNTV